MAPDVPASQAKVDLKPNSITFTGQSETKKTTYHIELEFYAEIDPAESKTHHSARDVSFVLRKKELKEEYWPRLTKSSQKLHFLKTDFDKWVDEDEQNVVADDDMANLSGMGGADGGFGGIDFSKLGGGAGGMPDMGAMGGDLGAGGDDVRCIQKHTLPGDITNELNRMTTRCRIWRTRTPRMMSLRRWASLRSRRLRRLSRAVLFMITLHASGSPYSCLNSCHWSND